MAEGAEALNVFQFHARRKCRSYWKTFGAASVQFPCDELGQLTAPMDPSHALFAARLWPAFFTVTDERINRRLRKDVQ